MDVKSEKTAEQKLGKKTYVTQDHQLTKVTDILNYTGQREIRQNRGELDRQMPCL